jgi:multiple sugar transport system permease protein/putative spermidine/putrescine transport system permease protein
MSPVWTIRAVPARWTLGLAIIAFAAIVFLLPIVTAVLWSLVDPDVGWFPPDIVPASLSLANWDHMLGIPELLDSLGRSLVIAALVTLLCTVLGGPTGFALGRGRARFHRVIEVLVLMPLMMPGIVLAVGLGAVFIRLGLSQTVLGVVLVQTAVILPLTIRIIAATARAIPTDLLDAARNLGAGSVAVGRHVVAPLLAPGILAAALLSFIGSLEEFLLSFVVGMPKVQTLPMLLWAYLGGRSAILSYAVVLAVVERFLKQEYLAAGFGKA